MGLWFAPCTLKAQTTHEHRIFSSEGYIHLPQELIFLIIKAFVAIKRSIEHAPDLRTHSTFNAPLWWMATG
jgi:hypothetical protein